MWRCQSQLLILQFRELFCSFLISWLRLSCKFDKKLLLPLCPSICCFIPVMYCMFFFVFFLHTERETKIRLQVVTWDILIPTDILWGIHLWSDYPRPFLMPGVNRHLDREQWLTDSYPCRAQRWLPQKCVRLLKPLPVRIMLCKQIEPTIWWNWACLYLLLKSVLHDLITSESSNTIGH